MSWKQRLFRLLGKDEQAVVVTFLSGPEPLARKMLAEVQSLVPDREHYAVTLDEGLQVAGVKIIHLDALPGPLRHKRIGLAPFLLNDDPQFRTVRRAALRMAPAKLLAYNERLERHHLRVSTLIASLLFLRRVPLDRIWLRPRWLWPWRRDKTVLPEAYKVFEGRPLTPGRARIAILSPYFPYPLSHGGAVRIFNLLRQGARDFDLFLFSFVEKPSQEDLQPVLDICAKVIAVPLPRYREPRWSTIAPPEAGEFDAPLMRRLLRDVSAEYQISLRQVEYTQMARYGGDILVEHDITFDLYQQVLRANPSLSAKWNLHRWRRFETRAVDQYRRVVVMSDKDAALLGAPHAVVIPNGVDLTRFQAQPEGTGLRILFVGSFRHFPNIEAFRFLAAEVWPLVVKEAPGATAVIIAGPDPEQYWQGEIPAGMELLGFISDVRPFYAAANVVVVPTTVSAGTNLKVLEAMAMERALVSTTSGCSGIGLEHGRSAWIADDAADFARGILTLLNNAAARREYAVAARRLVEQQFDWDAIGGRQRKLWLDLLGTQPVHIREGRAEDLPRIADIQRISHLGANWELETYLTYELKVAEKRGLVGAFLVSRDLGAGEVEILNLAVDPAFRREGIAGALINSLQAEHVILEVRESNVAAIALYQKMGFAEVGRRADYYDDPVENAIVMRRSRPPAY